MTIKRCVLGRLTGPPLFRKGLLEFRCGFLSQLAFCFDVVGSHTLNFRSFGVSVIHQRKPGNRETSFEEWDIEGGMRGGAYRWTGGSGGQEDGFTRSAAAPSVFLPQVLPRSAAPFLDFSGKNSCLGGISCLGQSTANLAGKEGPGEALLVAGLLVVAIQKFRPS